MEAFKGVEVRCTEWSEDGGLKVGMSNEIEVLAVTPDSHSSSVFFYEDEEKRVKRYQLPGTKQCEDDLRGCTKKVI